MGLGRKYNKKIIHSRSIDLSVV